MIDRDHLAQALSELDPGTRALLDLSLRRAIPDDQVAAVLGVDAASIPPRRARGIAELADKLEVPGPSELAALLLAIPELPEEAWAVPKVAPFSGKVSRARRARAFRRVAIAASPAVALGAVIAALMVSSGSDQTVNGTPTGATVGGGGGGGGGGAPAAAAAAPAEARHGLPDGSHLASASEQQRRVSHRRAARKQHRARRRHAPSSAEHAVQARQPSVTPRTTPVSFTPTPDAAPVGPQTPKHVTHRHESHKPAPKTPAPAPIKTPSVPIPAPVPAPPQQVTTLDTPPVETHQHSTLSAPVSTPNKSPKPPVPQPDIHPYGNGSGNGSYERHHDEGGGGGGGCGRDSYDSGSDSYDSGSDSYDSSSDSYDSGSDSYDAGQGQDDGGSAYTSSVHRHSDRSGFSPPGLFKKRYGPGRSGGR